MPAIPSTAMVKSILPPNAVLPLVDKHGMLTTNGLQMLQQMFNTINGLTPTIACTAANTLNKYTLTPANIAPNFGGYTDFTSFAFVAPSTSTGVVTATVVPNTGSAATLKVFKTNGSAQASSNDITINLFYLLFYVDSLDSGNGGLVLY